MLRPSPTAALLLAGLTALPLAAQDLPAPVETAEFSGPTMYAPLMEFVYELEARSDLMSVQPITTTLGGRDVLLCTLADPPVRRPTDALNMGKPIVLIVNNVHGTEVAGKDASLILMRDMLLGDLRPLLKKAIVLVVPTINPDGAEQRRRTNEQGFDLNRDYLKLESQEISALVTKVINRWQPHVHVDTHHGGSAPYVLVYQTCMNPAGDPQLMAFGNEHVLPAVRKALRAEDYDGYWYSGPRRTEDGWAWRPTSVEPRKQHVYSTLANMIGFLFETPSGSHRVVENGTKVVAIPRNERYRHQVRGQYLGLRAVVSFAANRADDVMAAVAGAKRRATERGMTVSEDDQLVLAYEQVEKFEGEFWARERRRRAPRTGPAEGDAEAPAPAPAPENGGYQLVKGPVMTKFVPTKTTTRPWGYFISAAAAKVVPALLDHEISVKRLTRATEVEVDALYATEVTERSYYQGHYLKQVVTTSQTETRTFPAGTFFVPMAQPKSNLIGYLLEPETDDSLATWNHLDNFIRVRDANSRSRMEQMMARWRAQQGEGAQGEAAKGKGEAATATATANPKGKGASEAAARGQEPRSRFQQRGSRRTPGQRIPIFRVMAPVPVQGELVERYDASTPRRYVR